MNPEQEERLIQALEVIGDQLVNISDKLNEGLGVKNEC